MEVIIEIDGARHVLMPDEQGAGVEFYCEQGMCSLYHLCKLSRDCLCTIHDPSKAPKEHYELEVPEAPDEDVYYR